jgi:hypothetical protein
VLFWSQTGESQIFRLEVLKDVEKQVQIIRENLKVARRDRKDMRIKEEGISHSKLVISYTLRFPL